MASDVQVYGTDWCGVTFSIREYLTNSHVDYEYHDIERDPTAHDFVLSMNEGRRRFPMVVVEERVMNKPTLTELQTALDTHGIRPVRRSADPVTPRIDAT